jgi:hypothetical protein
MPLDQAQLNALSPADRNRYNALEHLFAQPGWRIVVALAKENAEAQVRAAAFAKDWATNRLAVGNGAAWNAIVQLEESTHAAYTAKLAEIAGAAEAEEVASEVSWQT